MKRVNYLLGKSAGQVNGRTEGPVFNVYPMNKQVNADIAWKTKPENRFLYYKNTAL